MYEMYGMKTKKCDFDQSQYKEHISDEIDHQHSVQIKNYSDSDSQYLFKDKCQLDLFSNDNSFFFFDDFAPFDNIIPKDEQEQQWTEQSKTSNIDGLNKNLPLKKKTIIKKYKIEFAIPGESKNIYKCYGRQLQQFIKKIYDKPNNQIFKDNIDIKEYLLIPGDKIGKNELNKMIQSQYGRIIAKQFFGQCLWKYNIVKESKTGVLPLFRYNIEPFRVLNKKT